MDPRAETWKRHHHVVWRFAYHLCGDAAAADDLRSEAFVRLWTTGSDIRTETVRAYLLAITRNLFLKGRKRAARTRALEHDVADDTAGVDERIEARDEAARLRQVLGALDEQDRTALLMRHAGELSYRDIATALGITPGAARVRVHRAHRRLLGRMTADQKEQP